jgi:DGQHR domain-containing protein
MAKLSGIGEIELVATEARNLDTICYRGSAPLAHLALISQGDVFDQEQNPEGIQRDLSPKHASEAYEYAHRQKNPEQPRAFPEVVLNVRDKKIVQVVEDHPADLESATVGNRRVVLKFNLEAMRSNKVSVSRVDGNHRLYFADGDDKREPLLANAPFQIHVGLTREQERSLFVDINSNQKGLNTSHLSVMQGKLTPEEIEVRDHLDRWIANRLTEDAASPWHGQIHMGGSKAGTRVQGLSRPVNFVSLLTGVNRTLSKSQYIHDFTDPNAQYVIIRNYWHAVKTVFAEQWANPRQSLLLKNIGVHSMSMLGGTIIDRCVPRGKVKPEDFAYYLRQVKTRFDWSSDAPMGPNSVKGMTGNQAATIIAGEMAQELSDEAGDIAIKGLQEMLVGAVND